MRAAKFLSQTDAGFVRGAGSSRPVKRRFYSRATKLLAGGNILARAAVWPLEGSLPYEWQFPTPLALPHMRMTNKEISR